MVAKQVCMSSIRVTKVEELEINTAKVIKTAHGISLAIFPDSDRDEVFFDRGNPLKNFDFSFLF